MAGKILNTVGVTGDSTQGPAPDAQVAAGEKGATPRELLSCLPQLPSAISVPVVAASFAYCTGAHAQGIGIWACKGMLACLCI